MEDLKDIKECIAKFVNSNDNPKKSVLPVWAIFEQHLIKEKRKIITRGNLLEFNETLPKKKGSMMTKLQNCSSF